VNLAQIAVIIPSYNAEKTIGKVIEQLRHCGFVRKNIIVVNDGSKDKTGYVAGTYGVTLVEHEQNAGKGVALKSGFAHARKENFLKAFVVDADGQHNVSEVTRFLKMNGEYDIIIGERKEILRRMPLDRRLTNRTVNLVVSLLSGVRTMDVQCGFRYIDLGIFDKIELKTNRYETESEMVIKAARKKCRIGFVPVTTIYGNEQSHIDPLLDTIRFINMAVRFLWH
jgi:glycosyltransferase involved in cell wall biosynthesis